MRVVVVSTHRSDKAHYAPLLRCLRAVARFEVVVAPNAKVPSACAADVAVVLGDRYEMLQQAMDWAEHGTPLLHIHGGEHTYGSKDEKWRYAISAIADAHCVATADAYDELKRLGYEHVTVTGAPGLDGITDRQPFPNAPKIVVLYNPAIDEETTRAEAGAIAEAITGMDTWWVAPNGDRFSDLIAPNVDCVGLDSETFRDLLASAHVIVGNSSAGIIEAPSLGTWTVNVGARQAGRARAISVLDVPADSGRIREAIQYALGFERTRAQDVRNPYGDGKASARIRDVLLGMAK